MPRSCGLIRPSGRTAVASVRTSPAPPTARLPRCTKCQSLAYPSVLEDWHMGETNTRLANVISRIASGSKRGVIRCALRLLLLLKDLPVGLSIGIKATVFAPFPLTFEFGRRDVPVRMAV